MKRLSNPERFPPSQYSLFTKAPGVTLNVTLSPGFAYLLPWFLPCALRTLYYKIYCKVNSFLPLTVHIFLKLCNNQIF